MVRVLRGLGLRVSGVMVLGLRARTWIYYSLGLGIVCPTYLYGSEKTIE